MNQSRLATVIVALAVTALVSGACDLLEVTDPDIATPESLDNPEGVATLYAGALGDLGQALSGNATGHGGTAGTILYDGLLADEYVHSGAFPDRVEIDQRKVRIENERLRRLFNDVHSARAAAANAAEKIAAVVEDPSSDSRIAEMKNVEGLTYVVLGELFCSGVPFSRRTESGEIEFGEPRTTEEMFRSSIERFDQALSGAAGSAEQVNLARVLKGRALLDLGEFASADEVVDPVPTDFVYLLEHSASTDIESNGIAFLTLVRPQFSVANEKGTNGLPYRDADDPRVPWSHTPGEVGQDGQTLVYRQQKYLSVGASVALATGVEARLIQAEAALNAGDIDRFEDLHNALRNGEEGLAVVDADTMSGPERVDFHFQERAFWLWTTGHRVGDLRRLVRQYGRATEEVFPTGAYHKGGTYGSDVNLPVPQSEQNNPNFDACLDRGA